MRKGQSKIERDGNDKEVIKMVLDCIPYYEIAKKLGYDKDTIYSYVEGRLSRKLAIGAGRNRKKLTEDFMASLTYQQDKTEKLIDACDEWLRKPGTRGKKYTLDPRADEITVVYRTTEVDIATGKEHEARKECTLQELIDGREDIVSLKWKYADPRGLIVQALDQARKQNEIIARVTGELQEIAQTTDVYQVVTMVIKALTDDEAIPVDKRRALIKRIEEGMAVIEQEMLVG